MKKTNPFIPIGVGLVSLGTWGCGSEKMDPVSRTTPNIVLIVADDLGYADMSCTDLAKDAYTPNVDRLARSGVRFTQAYASSPICNPSRVSLITGVYHQRLGTIFYGGPGLQNASFPTIPELLKKKNYATGYVGKVHYGAIEGDFTVYEDTLHRSFPTNHGFDYYFGHNSPRKHYLNHVDSDEDRFHLIQAKYKKSGQSLRQGAMWENTSRVDTAAFSTDLFASKACAFIDQHRSEPFYLHLSFNAVHNFTHQLPKPYLDKNNLIGYHDWDPATEDYYEWYQKGRYPNNPEGRAHYLGQLHFMDRAIGKVLDRLEELELDKNTLIVFVSDNGGSTPIYANNHPLRGSKYVLYEGGIRVPMIISYPDKFQKNVVSENVVCVMDILPTICNLAGVHPPEICDGLDLTDLLTGQDKSIKHGLLVWDTVRETAVRYKNWKLRTAYRNDHATYEMVELELGEFLYKLEDDPGEKNNLISQYPGIAEKLRGYHKEWKEEVGMIDNQMDSYTE